VRHGRQRELDDAVERCLHLGRIEVLLVQLLGEAAARLGRLAENEEPRYMLRAFFGLGDEEGEVE
jgi:hypothetical protein